MGDVVAGHDRAALRAAGLVVTAAAALAALHRLESDVPRVLLDPHRLLQQTSGTDPSGLLVLVAASVCWLLVSWLLLCGCLTGLSRLPGSLGRAAAAAARAVTPAVVRRLLEAALGVTVVATSVGVTSGAALAAGRSGSRHAAVAQSTALGNAGLGGAALGAGVGNAAPGAGLGGAGLDRPAGRVPGLPSSLDRPTAPVDAAAAPDATTHTSRVPRLRTRRAPADPSVVTTPQRRPDVVVRDGDSLWSIAAAALGPDADESAIAHEWPRWYAANRDVVGADPGLIRPGEHLRPPGEHLRPPGAPPAAHPPRH